MKRLYFFLAFSVVFVFVLTAFVLAAQVEAVRVEKGPNIDGDMSDPIWQSASPFVEFRMVEPQPNQQPTEKTELRILYDDAHLYIGVICFDSEPSRISVNSMAHDSAGGSGGRGRGWGYGHRPRVSSDDLIRILIDPFQDKRSAYIFYVNPLGARSEGLVYGGNPSLD